jgi:hypothetical protein
MLTITWQPVKRYIEEEMKVFETDKGRYILINLMLRNYQKIIDTQHKIIQYLREITNKFCSAF